MPAEFVNGVFGSNQPAWHGAGVVVPEDAISWADVVTHVPELGLDVKKVPVWGHMENGLGFQVPDQVAIVREDNVYLGTVGNNYVPVQSSVAYDFLDHLLGERQVKVHTAGVLSGGRVTWVQCLRPENIRLKGLPDEELEAYISFMNSFDGSTKVGAIVGTQRVVCRNTFNAAIDGATNSYWFRHTTNVMSHLSEARRALGVAETYWQQVQKLGEASIMKPFSDRQFMGVLDTLIPLPSRDRIDYDPETHKRLEANAEREREQIQILWVDSPSIQNIRHTAWGAMNVWTEYLDHHTNSRNTTKSNQAENRLKRIWMDTSLRTRAVDLIREEAGV